MLWWLYFTGIVDDDTIPQDVLEKREENWDGLEEDEQDTFLTDAEDRSKQRRASMFEAANRSNFLLVALAFAVTVDAALLVVESNLASQVTLTMSLTLIVLAACILLLAISAKAKVLKPPRAGGESEPDEMLQRVVDRKVQPGDDPELVRRAARRAKRDSVMNKLYKRKLTLVVERRAQWVAVVVAVVGLMLMALALWLRLF